MSYHVEMNGTLIACDTVDEALALAEMVARSRASERTREDLVRALAAEAAEALPPQPTTVTEAAPSAEPTP